MDDKNLEAIGIATSAACRSITGRSEQCCNEICLLTESKILQLAQAAQNALPPPTTLGPIISPDILSQPGLRDELASIVGLLYETKHMDFLRGIEATIARIIRDEVLPELKATVAEYMQANRKNK